MKKKVFSVVAVAILGITAAWNVNKAENEVSLSNIILDNVEALAACETTAGGSCYWTNGYERCCHGGNFGCSPCD